MVEPFSEVGMVAQVSAIQSVTETMVRTPCGVESLPIPVEDLVVEELQVDISPSMSTCYDAVSSVPDVAPVRSLTPANRSLRLLETWAPGSPLTHELASHAAVPGMCIASTDLLSYIDPLPMDRLALYDPHTVRDWPAEDRN